MTWRATAPTIRAGCRRIRCQPTVGPVPSAGRRSTDSTRTRPPSSAPLATAPTRRRIAPAGPAARPSATIESSGNAVRTSPTQPGLPRGFYRRFGQPVGEARGRTTDLIPGEIVRRLGTEDDSPLAQAAGAAGAKHRGVRAARRRDAHRHRARAVAAADKSPRLPSSTATAVATARWRWSRKSSNGSPDHSCANPVPTALAEPA